MRAEYTSYKTGLTVHSKGTRDTLIGEKCVVQQMQSFRSCKCAEHFKSGADAVQRVSIELIAMQGNPLFFVLSDFTR